METYRPDRSKYYWRYFQDHDAEWWRDNGRYVLTVCPCCKKMMFLRFGRLKCKKCDATLAITSRRPLRAEEDNFRVIEREITMTETETSTETNGKPKVPSLVSKIRDEFLASKPFGVDQDGNAKTAPKSSIKPVLDEWRASQKALAAAQAAAKTATEQGYAAAAKLAKLVGVQPMQFDGALHEFTSRGDIVFLRSKSANKSVVEL